jgi:copper chaperone NosL
MDRKEHHRTRMLVQYSDDLADGVLLDPLPGLSLGVNVDREPKMIWGPDYGSHRRAAPAGAGGKADLPDRRRHQACDDQEEQAFLRFGRCGEGVQAKHGGTLGDFNEALKQSYLGMAEDVAQIRKNREERRKKMMMQKQG